MIDILNAKFSALYSTATTPICAVDMLQPLSQLMHWSPMLNHERMCSTRSREGTSQWMARKTAWMVMKLLGIRNGRSQRSPGRSPRNPVAA